MDPGTQVLLESIMLLWAIVSALVFDAEPTWYFKVFDGAFTRAISPNSLPRDVTRSETLPPPYSPRPDAPSLPTSAPMGEEVSSDSTLVGSDSGEDEDSPQTPRSILKRTSTSATIVPSRRKASALFLRLVPPVIRSRRNSLSTPLGSPRSTPPTPVEKELQLTDTPLPSPSKEVHFSPVDDVCLMAVMTPKDPISLHAENCSCSVQVASQASLPAEYLDSSLPSRARVRRDSTATLKAKSQSLHKQKKSGSSNSFLMQFSVPSLVSRSTKTKVIPRTGSTPTGGYTYYVLDSPHVQSSPLLPGAGPQAESRAHRGDGQCDCGDRAEEEDKHEPEAGQTEAGMKGLGRSLKGALHLSKA